MRMVRKLAFVLAVPVLVVSLLLWGVSFFYLTNAIDTREWSDGAGLVTQVRRLCWIAGALLSTITFILIGLEDRLLRRLLDKMIGDLRRGKAPTYRGIDELEFLSANIGRLVRNLNEREACFQESEAKYRTIFESTGTAIVLSEEDDTISLVNDQFRALTGFERDEVEGKKTWADFLTEDELEWMKTVCELRKEPSPAAAKQCEFTIRDKYGNHKDVILTAKLILGTTRTIASLIDVTDSNRDRLERQMAREKLAAEILRQKNVQLDYEIRTRQEIQDSLRVSEGLFRAVFETAEDCIFLKDTDMRYTHANPAMLRLLDMQHPEIVGKTDEDFRDDESAKHTRGLEVRVLKGETIESEETRNWKGWPIALNIIRFPVRHSSGDTIGICGIARNITERRIEKLEYPGTTIDYCSEAMNHTLKQLQLAAQTDSIILLLGESGSGKDLLARYLHDHSHRAGGPYFSVNCAALSPQLVESELFGYEKGAFTGACFRKRGLLELAEGGTLLLNEIGEMPLDIQAKLLTFLDTQSFTRIGGQSSVSVNARLVVATNRDLPKEVKSGRFRKDLFYRVSVMTIRVPPLRERREDLPLLASQLIESLVDKMGKRGPVALDIDAMEALSGYHWPGNVRELRNVLERALILCENDKITLTHLGPALAKGITADNTPCGELVLRYSRARAFRDVLEETKRSLITDALHRSGGSVEGAARLLSMTRPSLKHHMKVLHIQTDSLLSSASLQKETTFSPEHVLGSAHHPNCHSQ